MNLNYLKKQMVFIFQLEGLLVTTGSILALFGDRSIDVAGLHLNKMDAGEAKLMVHCSLEKDRVPRTVSLLRKLPGVLLIDWMESKG